MSKELDAHEFRLNLHLVSSSDLGGLTRAMVYDLYDENMADM